MANHARYNIKAYYRVVLLHAGWAVVNLAVALAGSSLIPEYEEATEVILSPEDHLYWVTGYTLGGLNVYFFLMSLIMYRCATSGIYTKRKKKVATKSGFCYGMLLGPNLLYGLAIVVYLIYSCLDLYRRTNYLPSKGIATTLLALHCAWIPMSIFMIWYFYHVYLQSVIIPIGKNLETYEFGLPPVASESLILDEPSGSYNMVTLSPSVDPSKVTELMGTESQPSYEEVAIVTSTQIQASDTNLLLPEDADTLSVTRIEAAGTNNSFLSEETDTPPVTCINAPDTNPLLLEDADTLPANRIETAGTNYSFLSEETDILPTTYLEAPDTNPLLPEEASYCTLVTTNTSRLKSVCEDVITAPVTEI